MGLEKVVGLWVRISIGISAGEEVQVQVDAGQFKFHFQFLKYLSRLSVPANLGNLVLG